MGITTGHVFGVNTKPWSSGQFTTLYIKNIKVEKKVIKQIIVYNAMTIIIIRIDVMLCSFF